MTKAQIWSKEHEPDHHGQDQRQRRLEQPVPQLTKVTHERHPAIRAALPRCLEHAGAGHRAPSTASGSFAMSVSRCLPGPSPAAGCAGRRGPRRPVPSAPPVAAAPLPPAPQPPLGGRRRLGPFLVEVLDLGLENAHRLAQRTRRARKLADPKSTMSTTATIRIFHGLSNRSPIMSVLYGGTFPAVGASQPDEMNRRRCARHQLFGAAGPADCPPVPLSGSAAAKPSKLRSRTNIRTRHRSGLVKKKSR